MLIGRPLQDLRYGARILARSPAFTAIVIVVLALGIGANAAVFSTLKAVILQALHYRDPGRLVALWETNSRWQIFGGRVPARARSFLEWQQRSRSLEGMSAYELRLMDLSGKQEPEHVGGARVSASVFKLLGVQPLLGRGLLPEEDQPGRDHAIVISYRLWQRQFGSDPGVLGSSLTLDGRSCTVVGVMPPDFEFPPESGSPGLGAAARARAELWKPIAFSAVEMLRAGDYNYRVLARLRPGVSIDQVQAEMHAIAAQLRQETPDWYKDGGVAVSWLYDEAVAGLRPAMLILSGAAGLVLLIVCANIANMLLARAAGRQREIAVRMALGASRLHIITQLLGETLLVALIGGAAGLFLSFWALRILALAPGIPRLERATVDTGALFFTVVASLLAGLLFGLAPAMQLSQSNVQEALKAGAISSTGGGRRGARVRGALMVFEIALSVVLLGGTILLLRSFVRVLGIDTGFNSRNLLTMRVSPPRHRYRSLEQRKAFFGQLEQKMETLPGVESVGLIDDLPLTAEVVNLSSTVAEGQARPERQGGEPYAEYRTVNADYFRALGISLLRGRGFTEHDTPDQPPVAIINTAMAHLFWPGGDAIGRRFKRGEYNEKRPWIEVIGVVADVRQSGLEHEPRPQVYRPAGQEPLFRAAVAVKTAHDPAAMASVVRKTIREIDSAVAVHDVQTMTQVVDSALGRRRFQTLLLAVFGVFALVLASAGVYGVVSYSVAQRRSEIAVRMALGGQRIDVLRLIFSQGLRLILLGIGIGLVAVLVLAQVLRGLLYGISPSDPASLVGTCLLVGASALFATCIPARQMIRIDPIAALKYE